MSTRPVPRPSRPSLRTLVDDARGERGSLPMVMLVVLIGMALGAVLVPVLVTQIRSSSFLTSRQDDLAAAQSGVDFVVGRIRAAAPNGTGDSSRIPCASSGVASGPGSPITGTVGSPGTGAYRVTVQYYLKDPVVNPGQNPMTCVPGKGPYTPGADTNGTVTPGFARITSTGTAAGAGQGGRSQGRTIVSTYTFKTTNRNVAAGQIYLYKSDRSARLCLDAGSSPAPQTALTVQTCNPENAVTAQQLWAYRSDLTLQLVSSTNSYDNGLCITPTGDGSNTQGGAPADGARVVLGLCNPLGNPPFQEQWSLSDDTRFHASNSDTASTGTLSDYVLHVDGDLPSAGAPVYLADPRKKSNYGVWVPNSQVGAGAAAAPQLVNFAEFGRCLDLDSYQPKLNWDHILIYPCKQNPKSGAVLYNQKFYYDATNRWLYNLLPDGKKYCLMSQQAEGKYVQFTLCDDPGGIDGYDYTEPNNTYPRVPNATAAKLIWTMRDGSTDLPYSKRYIFVDSSTDAQRCLGVGPPTTYANRGLYDPNDDWAVTATCDGSTAQKWNADPNVSSASINDITEGQFSAQTATPSP